MGKLGGEDLNFSSDIDLIFVYDEEGRTEGALDPAGDRVNRVTNHEFFTRLGERLIAFLSEPSDEGILFRVDMRLRPEGKSGPLARSLGAYDAYFASQARPWEKVAYLKARRIAGDEALGRAFDDLAARFVFSDTPPAILIEELARLKRRIDSEVLEGETRERDLKRGVGGIREIEFITSLRQLLTGAARPALRLRPTPEALDALARAGELPEDEAARLRDTYFFLRRLEHRLQMRAERQTYLLPESEEDWGALARRMGAREGGALEAGRALRAEFQSRTQEVHEIFRRHFQGMEATISAADAASPVELLLTARAESDPKPALELLRRNGFIRPEAALRALREMALGSAEIAISSSGQRWFEALLPALLEQAPRLPDPDAAVAGLLQFLRANKGIALTYQLLAARPAILRLLLLAFGCGAAPARPLIAHPEWFEEILAQGALAPGFDIAGQEPEIAREVLGAPDDSEAWRRLRLWKEKNFVILALLDILNIEPEPRLGRLTTDLAEICVRAVAARVERRLTEFHGAPAAEGAPGGPALRWTMLGLGGFGGRRVSFFSDLDVVLIYSGEGRSPGESGLSASHWFSRLGEEILGVLSAVSPEGQLFKMDARLRPEGRGAPLAASLERYLSYYAGAAQTWEWQAALKARRVAGDEALAAEFLGALRRQTPARFPDRAALAAEVRSMRARLAAAAKTPSWAEADFKRGAGGLTDVDFIVQFLQLAHAGRLLAGYGGAERAADTGREAGAGNEAQGAENAAAARREPFPTDTAEALERLADAGILPPEAAAQLREDHDFLRSLQRRQRLFFETSRDFFPATPAVSNLCAA
jgi:glutamate-ammonia-ligase adenylyltransferase